MEKKQKTSLTWQLILTMVVIVAGTVAMCWFFNTTFLEKYYIFHKEKELKSSFDQVRLICEKQGDSSDDAYVQFERICANGNINMLIADQDRNLIWSSYSSAQRFQMQMEDWLYGSDRFTISAFTLTSQRTTCFFIKLSKVFVHVSRCLIYKVHRRPLVAHSLSRLCLSQTAPPKGKNKGAERLKF